MKRTILLAGKTGQVGSELLVLLPQLGEVAAPDRHELDFLNADSIRRAVREIRPELIINAAAFTAVDAAETQEPEARAINADAPEYSLRKQTRLVQQLSITQRTMCSTVQKQRLTMRQIHPPQSTSMEKQNWLVSRPFTVRVFLT